MTRRPRPSKTLSQPIRIGYVPLADAAPLIAAEELGWFEKQGLQVELHREVGWATIREKILYNELDAAHAPAGLAFSLRLGVHGQTCRSLAPFVFNRNGNAVTLSTSLYERGVRDAASLKMLIRSTPQSLFTFGVVAPCSSHNILLRTWLESGGIDPDNDVRIVMLPPPQMPGSLAAGLLDGYCSGEPWNSAAVVRGTGWCPATSQSIAPGHPEKILLTTEDFAEQREDDLVRLVSALAASCAYCDESQNRHQLPQLLSAAFRHPGDRDLLKLSLVGPFETGLGNQPVDRFHVFHREDTNRPTPSQARWLIQNFIEHGIMPASDKAALVEAAEQCWISDFYDRAVQSPPSRSRSRKPSRSKTLSRTQTLNT